MMTIQIFGRIIPLIEQRSVWKHLVCVAKTVTVDFQHNSHRDVQEEKNARIDVHRPVMLRVEVDVKRRTVSRLYYILQAKQSEAKKKTLKKNIKKMQPFTSWYSVCYVWPKSLSRKVS